MHGSIVLYIDESRSNWNLEMLVFEERGKPEYPEKNLSEQSREPTTNSTTYDAGSGNPTQDTLVGPPRRALSPLRQSCSPYHVTMLSIIITTSSIITSFPPPPKR